ncbi:hypothetical protein CRN67_08875 [Campylobacter blaseri]|uniref:FMN-dependent dehydrogenase domain-containing protein n=2 Tax=Campylobacter blaseri TaxID=2042961 RepID=A0A2P8QYN0_9BACT|nr:hypothetical protein CQ405_08870 [Campylobacter blaseri]PSM52474.1 hypothetical protein CRN67_08875 [Campylobacter blaseri]
MLTCVKNASYTAIISTVDALGPGQSENFIAVESSFHPDKTFGNHDPKIGGSGNFLNQKTSLTTKDIEFIKSFTRLPVIVKGVLRADDAKRFVKAVAMGADAVAVGRPILYGLGLDRSQGVKSVIDFLNKDLVAVLILSDAGKLSDLDSSYIDIVGENSKFSTYK